MAKLREKKKEEGADDLEVLHPERIAVIAGRQIAVREYGFVEGLRLLPLAEPIVAALQALVGHDGTVFDAVLAAAAEHPETVVRLMAAAADVEVEWIESLDQNDGHLLLMMWWGANGPFYLRRAALRLVGQGRAGATSTPPSSAPATEAPPTSAG